MKLTKRARIIAVPVLVLVLALAVFAAHQLRRELTPCHEWPVVEMRVEDEPNPDFAYSEHTGDMEHFTSFCAGADMDLGGERDPYYVPSLCYLSGLLTPQWEHCALHAGADTEYLSIRCSQGELKKQPNSLAVYRISLETVESLPQTPEEWADGTTIPPLEVYGTRVPVEKHGGSWRIYEPELGCVYVCRSVWDAGVVEHAWLVEEG